MRCNVHVPRQNWNHNQKRNENWNRNEEPERGTGTRNRNEEPEPGTGTWNRNLEPGTRNPEP
jgi:hypothetical protein